MTPMRIFLFICGFVAAEGLWWINGVDIFSRSTKTAEGIILAFICGLLASQWHKLEF